MRAFYLPTIAANPQPPASVEPSAGWDGTAATGFGGAYGAVPTDPTRPTAQPAARLIVPPGQFFTDTLVVGVAAAANNGGSMANLGLSGVTFHFEGNTAVVSQPTLRTFPDANGNNVTYLAWWVTLKKPAATAGEARLYVTATPADGTMQARVMGPYSFYPSATLHDFEYTIDTGASVSATNFHTFDAFKAQLVTDTPDNPHLRCITAPSNGEMNFAGTLYVPTGYITVEADVPVTFGRTALTTGATVDSDSNLRPRADGIWLKGSNITIDYAYVDNFYNEGSKNHVFDGINMINSRGAGALWRGGPYFTGTRVRNNPYFLEVTASNLENIAVGASLVRGGTFGTMSRDMFADVLCVTGTRVEVHDDTPFNNDTEAFTVVYTGSEATATVARSGTVDPNSATYTFKWGANTQTFDCGKTPAIYATGLSGNQGYLFSHLVTWINATLAGLDAGWSATLVDATGRRASSGALLGDKGQGFGDTSCKTTALSVRSNFDAHGDWYQQRFAGPTENLILYNNLAYDMQTQAIFVSSNTDASDFIFFNNSLGHDNVGSDYFNEDTVFSQIGRNSHATAISHVVIAHCSMPNQQIYFRNDGTLSTFDSYCLIANNSTVNVDEAGSGTINATITGNHIHGDQTAIAEALLTTSGGNEDNLYVDFTTGDFTPAGALLTNLKAPIVARDMNGRLRAASDAAGALAI